VNKVVLNKTEAGWVSRNVPKMLQLLDASERKNKGVKERKTHKILTAILPKAEKVADALKAFGDELYEIEMYLNRAERLFIREMIRKVKKGLVEGVIPEYERRGPAMKGYLISATNKADMLDKMERKFSR
jgi:hypothetical protein